MKNQQKTNLEILKSFGELADEFASQVTPDSYWLEEEKLIRKLEKQFKKERDSRIMSYEKYHTPFTI